MIKARFSRNGPFFGDGNDDVCCLWEILCLPTSFAAPEPTPSRASLAPTGIVFLLWERGLPEKNGYAGKLTKRGNDGTGNVELPQIWDSLNPNQTIRAVSAERSSLIATNLEVGVLLPSPTLSSGTNGLTSG